MRGQGPRTAGVPNRRSAELPVQGGRKRVVIKNVSPRVEGGRFPVKRTGGETVRVEADIFADGHDAISGMLVYRHEAGKRWSRAPLEPLGNDRWRAEFRVTELGGYRYALRAWTDPLRGWLRDLQRRLGAGQDVSTELLIGAKWIEQAAARASGQDARRLKDWAAELRVGRTPAGDRARRAMDPGLAEIAGRYSERRLSSARSMEYEVWVERERARFGSWYEMFPRSCAPEGGGHGAFRDCAQRLSYVAAMGFDVLYLPPIHPIGRTHRKGGNNALVAGPRDPGSPWAMGAEEGGHKSLHPQLGTIEDFRGLLRKAGELGIEVALDIAFQCSPDHPYVREHPSWFRHRPDGSVQYAENPPKKYEDIYPFDFECADWRALWLELKSIFVFWAEEGVRIFRVDNPHTKPFAFWEWLIRDLRRSYPDAIFLSEAFTRPKVKYHLAQLGFTQSYNYFPWRNTKLELTEYLTELAQSPVREYFRPSFWTNTPDILTEYLQSGGRPAFMARFVLAATLGASYGIYGPAFELCENRPLARGREEYLDSEKYEIRRWDLDRPDSLKDLIARVNRIRREHPALQSDWSLRFHRVDNDEIICYSKRAGDDVVLAAVNLDPHHKQSGWTDLRLDELGLDPGRPYRMHDLLTDARYLWQGPRNYVELRPEACPAHIFLVRPAVDAGTGSGHRP
ncbi:MAG: alpha-1,4-glucan--maltose-1-phosphate maltosyltransferase [Elusimicrobiota bacterium]